MTNRIGQLQMAFEDAIENILEAFNELRTEIQSVDKPELIMHDGKQLKKVEREAEKGDYVRFAEDFGHGTKLGKFYKVIEDDQYLDDKGVTFYVYGWEGEGKAVEGVYEVVYETVDRVAGIGERILITNPDEGRKDSVGGVFTVESVYKRDIGIIHEGSVDVEELPATPARWTFRRHEYEVIIEPEQVPITKELTANEQRAELIEKAKRFVEKYREDIGAYRDVGNDTARRNFYETEFFIKGNKVTAVVYRLDDYGNRFSGKPSHVGRALCMPGEVFNNWVGKAIALARALGIDVPEEFLNAVQPDEIVVGMEVSANDSMNEYTVGHFYKEKRLDGELGEAFFPVGHRMDAWLGVNQVKVINDTNAIYEEVANQ